MSLANMPKAKDAAVADRETEIVRLLLQHMPVEALNTQSGTGASVTHLAVPKGNHALTEQVLWALYSKGGWSAVEHHLGLANHMGKSALDLALRSNVAFAKVLRDQWWAVSLTPAPSTDERDYTRAGIELPGPDAIGGEEDCKTVRALVADRVKFRQGQACEADGR